MRFDHKHYVPILKTKAGERWALSHLAPGLRSDFTPLMELHPHDELGVGAHAADICEALEAIWSDAPFFLDTVWFHSETGNPAVIDAVFSAARAHSLSAIPVVRLTYGRTTLQQIRAEIDEDDRGYLLRLTPDEIADTHRIDAVLGDLELPASEVHLMLDYRGRAMNLLTHVPTVPHLEDWRTFTSASGSFPRSLATLPLNAWQQLPRHDWTTWESAVAGGGLARLPAYGDYTTRDYGEPAAGGRPSVNLRYTTDNHWLVQVGGKVAAGAAPDFKRFCQQLISRPEYTGQAFSAGDQELYSRAQLGTSSGGSQSWVQWSINHHLTFVNQQIQTHAGL